jgi:hypothetical protein
MVAKLFVVIATAATTAANLLFAPVPLVGPATALVAVAKAITAAVPRIPA